MVHMQVLEQNRNTKTENKDETEGRARKLIVTTIIVFGVHPKKASALQPSNMGDQARKLHMEPGLKRTRCCYKKK